MHSTSLLLKESNAVKPSLMSYQTCVITTVLMVNTLRMRSNKINVGININFFGKKKLILLYLVKLDQLWAVFSIVLIISYESNDKTFESINRFSVGN